MAQYTHNSMHTCIYSAAFIKHQNKLEIIAILSHVIAFPGREILQLLPFYHRNKYCIHSTIIKGIKDITSFCDKIGNHCKTLR